MRINYLGHACFKINDSLVIDPYKDGSVPGLSPLRITAEKVICSHEHADHSGRECVEIVANEKQAGNQQTNAADFQIEEIPSWHDDQNGALRGPNTIFVITSKNPDDQPATDEKLVHLGDLGHFPNEAQLAKISDADYLLIPVGGFFTIDAKTAVEICKAANPKTIIPMHYRTAEYGYPELATVDEFVKLANEAGLGEKVKILLPKI